MPSKRFNIPPMVRNELENFQVKGGIKVKKIIVFALSISLLITVPRLLYKRPEN